MTHTPKFSVTMDASDPRAQGEFRALALGYVREAPPAPHGTWEEALTAWSLPEERWNDANAIVDPDGLGPRIFIQKVPEPKTAKNRLHIDVHSNAGGPDQPKAWDVMRAKAAKLVAAGADVVEEFRQPPQGEWIVMEDPEGNEFCVV